MSNTRQNYKGRSFYLGSAFFLLFVALSLAFTPVYAAAVSQTDAAGSSLSQVLRAWWPVPYSHGSQHAFVLTSRDALPAWIPPGEPASEPRPRPLAQSLSYIVIRTAAGGLGVEAGPQTMDTDDTWTLYAAGYDAGDNYLGDVAANWSVTGNIIGQVAPTTGISTTLDATTPGAGQVVAGYATATGDSTGNITVSVGALGYIVIEDAAGGVGSAVTTHSMTAGQTFQVWAAGYDADGNYTGDESVTWSGSDVVAGRLSPVSGSSTTFAAEVAGTGMITATHASAGTDSTGTITVNPGALTNIVIRDAAGGLGDPVTTHSMTAGQAFQVWVAGYDAYGNYTGDEVVSWSGTGVVTGHLSPVSGSSTTFTSEAAGTGIIQATHASAGSDNTGTITVNAGPLDHILIRDDVGGAGSEVTTHSMTAGETFQVWAAGYDAYGNYIGDESVTWSGTDVVAGRLSPVSGISTTFTSEVAGTGIIQATHATASNYSTGTITVNPGTPNSIVIRDAAGGLGDPVTIHSMTAGQTFQVWAAGYDAYSNYTGDEVVTWSGTGVVTGRLSPVSGGSTTFTAQVAGTGIITATHATAGSDSTGTITVNPGAPTSIVIRDAAGGAGDPVTTHVMTAGQTFQVWAAGYDAYGNYTGDVSVTWSGTGVVFGRLSPLSGSNTTFTAQAAGTGSIQATHTTAGSDSTGTITVNPGALDHIMVRSGAGGTGSEVTTHSMTAGQTFDVWAAGYDAYGNYTGDETVTWSGTGVVTGRLSPVSAISTTFTAEAAGTGIIQATHGTAGNDSTGTITVNPGPPSSIVIRDAAGGFGDAVTTHSMAAGETFQVWAAGYDVYGNYTGDESVTWSGTGVVFGRLSPLSGGSTTFTSQVAGTGIIQAVHVTAGSDNTGTITVNPGPLDHVIIRTASNGGGIPVVTHDMTIYQTLTVWLASYDVYDNYRGDLSVDWQVGGVLAEGDIVPSSGASTTFIPAPILSGTGTITATHAPSGLVDSTDLVTVRAPRLIISKSDDPEPVSAGGFLLYTVVYTNVGNAVAQNVRITETYDSNVSFVSGGPPPSAPPNIWTHATLGVGASKEIYVTVQVAGSLVPGTLLTNLVTIGADRVEQHSFSDTTVVTSAPDLTLTLEAQPNPVDAGSNLVYQITYSNQGNAPVTGVYITMTYDSNVTFLSSDPAPVSGKTNVWFTDTLAGMDSKTIDVTVVVDSFMSDGDALLGTAVIKSDLTAPFFNFEDTNVHAPALALAQAVTPNPVDANGLLTYTLTYTNVGRADALSVVLTDAIPNNTNFNGCTPGCVRIGDEIRWNLGTLAEGASGTKVLVVKAHNNLDNGTVLSNMAGLEALHGYSATAQIATTVVSSPSLWLAIENGLTTVEAGHELVYTLVYSNTGNSKAYDTTIVATPSLPQYVSAMGCVAPAPASCALSDGSAVFDVGTVLGGLGGSVVMTVTVEDPLPAGARILTASAVISTVTPGDLPEGNSAQDPDDIVTRPDLVVVAGYQDIMPFPGKLLTYTLQYSNEGHMGATGVAVTATLPSHTTFQENASDPGWVAQGNGRYRFEAGDLSLNEGGELLFVVTLTTNHFTTAMTNFDASFEIGSVLEGRRVYAAPLGVPNLVIERVVSDPWIFGGQSGYLTITVRNTGTGPSCGVYNPIGCTTFALDIWLDPETPPQSYPIEEFGHCFDFVSPIPPGGTETVNIFFTSRYGGEAGLCGTATFKEIWLKADNWDPNTPPTPDGFGLVPEFNEFDNVYGPFTLDYDIYLPLLFRNW